MNFLNCLATSSGKLRLWIKFLGICALYTLIFLGPAKAQTFSTPGAFTFTVPNFSGSLDPGDMVIVDVDLIIVGAGGGGGRGNGAGGGGGGQVIQITITASEGDVLTGFIGTGGAGRTGSDGAGSNGTASTFSGYTSQGGFGGGGGNTGSGGISGSSMVGGLGEENSSREAGGGGGGAGGAGIDGDASANPVGGNGGIGIVGYGGGGGGTATRPGSGGTTTLGTATNGGTSGSTGNASNATNGGGGGGGRSAGGRGGHGVVVVTVNFRVLPVEFLYFKSDYNSSPRSGVLSWSTAKEWENSHFEIERSISNASSWEKIGQVQGADYSDQPVEYKYQDLKLPLSGGNIFYRLKQVDLNGKAIYSEIRAIQTRPIEGSSSWRVYPNPTTGDFINLEMLENATYKDEKVIIRIISTTSQNYVIQGSNSSQLNAQLTEFLKGKTGGIYTLEINWGENREYHKVILRR